MFLAEIFIRHKKSRHFNGDSGIARSIFVFMIILLMPNIVIGATAPGVSISNTAIASYLENGAALKTINSNTANLTIKTMRTQSTVDLLHYSPLTGGSESLVISQVRYSPSGSSAGPFVPLALPADITTGATIDLTAPVSVSPAELLHQGEALFIRLSDLDQNIDPVQRETVLVIITSPETSDTVVLQLTESGVNTGIFAGYIQTEKGDSPVINDAVLTLRASATLQVRYIDIVDGSDSISENILIDPYGLVFDSENGQMINGVSVSLVSADTGLPARVYGDNALSDYPSTVITGGSVKDAGGDVYDFPAGGYRFPFVAPGNYRLVVSPMSGYVMPSQMSTADLQVLPNGPFVIAEPGSRGEVFGVSVGPAIRLDIPLDPLRGSLYVQKQAQRGRVAIGDFLRYAITVSNDGAGDAANVRVVDTLPLGFRYQSGSATLSDGAGEIIGQTISSDGRTLNFSIGTVEANAKITFAYVVEVGAGAKVGKAVNNAIAIASDSLSSNKAQASVMVTEDLWRSSNTLVGRVLTQGCDANAHAKGGGLSGVRVYMEDGRFSSTDEYGRFHFDGVNNNTHVIQVDHATVPAYYEFVACEESTRFAGNLWSQFVDLKGGALWRSDFYLRLRPRKVANIMLGLDVKASDSELVFELDMQGGQSAIDDIRATVSLPEGVHYVEKSALIDNAPAPAPKILGSMLIFDLGDEDSVWGKKLRFKGAYKNKVTQESQGNKALKSKALLVFSDAQGKSLRTPIASVGFDRPLLKKEIDEEDRVMNYRFNSLSASLTETDKRAIATLALELQEMPIIGIEVVGHTDAQSVKAAAKRIYSNNYALSLARAKAVVNEIEKILTLTPDAIKTYGRGADSPVGDNATSEGRAKNRRTELRLVLDKTLKNNQVKQGNDRVTLAVEGLRFGEVLKENTVKIRGKEKRVRPDYDTAWLDNEKPARTWLWPKEAYIPAIPSIKIAIAHEAKDSVILRLNGKLVSALNFEARKINSARTIAVSLWSGVDIKEGVNYFEVIFKNAQGKEVKRIKRSVHYAATPVRAELVESLSRLNADGQRSPVIALRFLDRFSKPVRAGVVGEFSVDAPHQSKQSNALTDTNALPGAKNAKSLYRIEEDGIAYIALEPTTRAGEVTLRFAFDARDQALSAWLNAEQRDWILVALAEGSAGYNTINGNMQAAEEAAYARRSIRTVAWLFLLKDRFKGNGC